MTTRQFSRQGHASLPAFISSVNYSVLWSAIQAIARDIREVVSFGADAVTLVLGTIALWALIFHKRKVALFIRVLLSSFLNERVKRTKETLGKLESLNYDNKEDRAEIFALLGQVSGQIKPFSIANTDLATINEEVHTILAKKTRLNEATKRRLMYEMHAALDGVSYTETRAILESKE
jgi:hypothetical protein